MIVGAIQAEQANKRAAEAKEELAGDYTAHLMKGYNDGMGAQSFGDPVAGPAAGLGQTVKALSGNKIEITWSDGVHMTRGQPDGQNMRTAYDANGVWSERWGDPSHRTAVVPYTALHDKASLSVKAFVDDGEFSYYSSPADIVSFRGEQNPLAPDVSLQWQGSKNADNIEVIDPEQSGFWGTIVKDYKEPGQQSLALYNNSAAAWRSAYMAAWASPSFGTIGNAGLQFGKSTVGETLGAIGWLTSGISGAINTVTKPASRGIDYSFRATGLPVYKEVHDGDMFSFRSHYELMSHEESTSKLNNNINLALIFASPARGVTSIEVLSEPSVGMNVTANSLASRHANSVSKFGAYAVNETRILAAETTGPRLIGSYTPSANLKFGTTLFGDEAHVAASRILTEELTSRGVPLGSIIDRTGPGLTGVDMSIDPIYAKQLGFEHIEIKPNTQSGLNTMSKQIGKWGYSASSVRPVTYDASGNIRDGFDF